MRLFKVHRNVVRLGSFGRVDSHRPFALVAFDAVDLFFDFFGDVRYVWGSRTAGEDECHRRQDKEGGKRQAREVMNFGAQHGKEARSKCIVGVVHRRFLLLLYTVMFHSMGRRGYLCGRVLGEIQLKMFRDRKRAGGLLDRSLLRTPIPPYV